MSSKRQRIGEAKDSLTTVMNDPRWTALNVRE